MLLRFLIVLLLPLLLHAEHLAGKVFLRVKPATIIAWDIEAPKEHAINIIVASDGYREDQMDKFPLDVGKLVNTFESVAPYSNYRPSINWWLVPTVSNQSGASKPGIDRDTYWKVTYNINNTRRLTAPRADAWASFTALIKSEFPAPTDIIAIILSNDTEYGGGGGVPATVSVHNLSGWICVHETAHSWVLLWDEYALKGWPLIRRANSAVLTNDVPWIAKVGQNGIGVFPRGDGGYRPVASTSLCLMGSFDKHAFCDVCLEAIEKRISQQLNK